MRTSNAMIGHNLPPTDAEILADKLAENARKELADMDTLLGFLPPESVNNEEESRDAETFVKRLKDLKKTFEATHKSEKKPYLEMGRVVDEFFKRRAETLDLQITKWNEPRTAFLNKKAEQERKLAFERAEKARIEAEKLAAEALAHEQADIKDTAKELMEHAVTAEQKAAHIQNYAATAKASKFVGGLVTRWVGEIQEIGGVDLEKLRQYFTEEQLQTAINKFIRDGGRDLPGVKIYQKSEAK